VLPNRSRSRLPFFFWAYPREFQSADAASQLAGSPYQFKRPGRQNYMMLLMHGYGILDGPTMPIDSPRAIVRSTSVSTGSGSPS